MQSLLLWSALVLRSDCWVRLRLHWTRVTQRGVMRQLEL